MAETYPAEVETFTVVGRLVRGLADTGDEDTTPDIVPITTATITFTPSVVPPIFKVNSTPPITLFQETVVATTDSEGYLTTDGGMTRGVMLMFGGSANLSPVGWTWNVKVVVGGNFPERSFSFYGQSGGTVDLATVVNLPANPGGAVAEWVAVLDDINEAKDEMFVITSALGTVSGTVPITNAQSKHKYRKYTLGGNTNFSLASGTAGEAYSLTLELTQDATGGRTVVINNAQTPYGLPVPVESGAGAVTTIRCEWNGTVWRAYLGGSSFSVPAEWVV